MRRVVFGFAFFSLVLAGCQSTAAPDISFESMRPKDAQGFSLADPEYAVYDLSRLRVGMTRAEVYKLFSRPDVVKKTPRDEYWEYGWFELYFREDRLVNWFDLPEIPRQKFIPSSRSLRAARQGAFEERLP
jgi:outer membrane protein assembly factor BamE (lipoprotein component of BamABCDE complex)